MTTDVTGFETESLTALILHIHREVIDHGAEIALPRVLYRARSGESRNRVILESPGIVVR